MEKIETATLANGLRVIYEPSEGAVAYCGYVVNAGTRDERADQSGMAHFMEHMTFKGTARRDSWHVNNAIESVGGDMNAYTGKEETVYYAALPASELPRAVDVMSDMVFHSTYQQREIDKEVKVIADEIESYNDNPAELIFDEFEELIYRGHALGRSILGTKASLATFTTREALAFAAQYYRPANATFFVYGGRTPFARIVRLLERATAGLTAEPADKERKPLPAYGPQEVKHKKGTHMAHVILGARAYDGRDERRTTLFLLNNILGGPAMNSRLNIVLREHSGLVYTVESYTAAYTDAGMWGVYFGCDPKNTGRCRRLVGRELADLTTTALTPARLAAAKRRIKGQMLIGRNDLSGYAIGLGRAYAKYGRVRDMQETFRRIDAVTSGDIRATAAEILAPEHLTTLIYE